MKVSSIRVSPSKGKGVLSHRIAGRVSQRILCTHLELGTAAGASSQIDTSMKVTTREVTVIINKTAEAHTAAKQHTETEATQRHNGDNHSDKNKCR